MFLLLIGPVFELVYLRAEVEEKVMLFCITYIGPFDPYVQWQLIGETSKHYQIKQRPLRPLEGNMDNPLSKSRYKGEYYWQLNVLGKSELTLRVLDR